MDRPLTRVLRLLVAVTTLALAGCATVPPNAGSNPTDPWERYNRNMFAFNDAVDRAVVKPIAQGYEAVVPSPVRTCVGNFFANLRDVPTAVNNVLQGKPVDAINDASRVLVNTTLGIGGCFDIASRMGMPKNEEDFGQTLGRWGSGSGPYLVLPLLGPSTVRDAFGRVPDAYATPQNYLQEPRDRNWLRFAEVIDLRASLLAAERAIEGRGLDRYQFIRDAYLQRRRNLVADGQATEDVKPPTYEDPGDDDPAPPAGKPDQPK